MCILCCVCNLRRVASNSQHIILTDSLTVYLHCLSVLFQGYVIEEKIKGGLTWQELVRITTCLFQRFWFISWFMNIPWVASAFLGFPFNFLFITDSFRRLPPGYKWQKFFSRFKIYIVILKIKLQSNFLRCKMFQRGSEKIIVDTFIKVVSCAGFFLTRWMLSEQQTQRPLNSESVHPNSSLSIYNLIEMKWHSCLNVNGNSVISI